MRLHLRPGELHIYDIPLRKDEFLRLQVAQLGLDVTVAVRGPDGQKMLEMDSYNLDQGFEDVPVVAGQAGVHEIQVAGPGSDSQGTYQVKILAQRPASDKDRLRRDAAVSYWEGRRTDGPKRTWQQREVRLREAVRLWTSLGWKRGQADAFSELGGLLERGRRWRSAREVYAQALMAFSELGDTRQQQGLLYQLGFAQQKLLDLPGARRSYEAALAGARKSRSQTDVAALLVDLGLVLLNQGEFARADSALEEAQSLRDDFGTRSERAGVLNALGRSRFLMGDCRTAFALHWQALAQLDPAADLSEIATTYLHLGDAFDAVHDGKRAVSFYLRALRLRRQMGDVDEEANVLNNLAVAYFHAGRVRRASEAQELALHLYQELGDDSDAAIAWANVGRLATELSEPLRAREAYEAAQTLLACGDDRPPLKAAVQVGLARLDRLEGNLDAAIQQAEQSIETIETMRGRIDRQWLRLTFLANSQSAYALLIDLLMERNQRQPRQGSDCEALQVSERARARVLLENLTTPEALPGVSVRALQHDLLDDDSMLLEYFFGDNSSYLWAVTQTSCQVFSLPPKEVMVPLVRDVFARLERSVSEVDLGESYSRALQLSRILLGPLGQLPRERRLVIAAPAELQSLPFAALPNPFLPNPASGKGRWPHPLLESKEIVSEPSMSVLAAIRAEGRQRGPAPRSLAVLAVPEVLPPGSPDLRLATRPAGDSAPMPSARSFPPLRFWREEAGALEREARGWQVMTLYGAEAQVDRVIQGELADFQILHFLTHGVFDEEHPERSALVLSGADGAGRVRDPFLTAKEVEGLHLRAELVVLSGCQSGRGSEVSGEGLVGLSRAFFAAGATRLVASVFDVFDPDAPAFMAAFYHGLLAENRSPGDALRQAQLATWRQPGRDAPASWAGFIHLGEWR
jgi:CHAT domain-containing protein